MFIRKSRFKELVKEKESLEDEVMKQGNAIKEYESKIAGLVELLDEASKINNAKANENGCMIGDWCARCIYSRRMYSINSYWEDSDDCFSRGMRYVHSDLGYYCMKHIKDICPEFEGASKG